MEVAILTRKETPVEPSQSLYGETQEIAVPEWADVTLIDYRLGTAMFAGDDNNNITIHDIKEVMTRRPLIQGAEPGMLRTIRRDQTYTSVLAQLEKRVEKLIEGRHEHPMWPGHSLGLDAFEREYHGPVRHAYYQETIFLIQLLRQLRRVA